MTSYAQLSDDFYLNMHLATELELPQTREGVVHFFEQIQRRYPTMSHFYARERGEFILEEERDRPSCRWVSLESRRMGSWSINPNSVEEAVDQHATVLELAPFALSVSHLDCESLNVSFGFDFQCRGNHNQVVAEALGFVPALDRLANLPGTGLMAYEPSIQLTLDESCRTQCRIGFETRTNPAHLRTQEFPEEPLTVFVTVRRIDSLQVGETYAEEVRRLAGICRDLIDQHLAEHILLPLQRAIAMH